MKSMVKFLGVIAIAAIAGFSFVTCDTGNSHDEIVDDIVDQNGVTTGVYNNMSWRRYLGAVTITSSHDLVGAIEIPAAILGYPVTSIGDWAFAASQLTAVNIPNSVTYIGSWAFAENQLTAVDIPNSVTHLNGFVGNQLTTINIPNSVTYIGGSAFASNQLTTVNIPNSVTYIGGGAHGGAFAFNQLTTVNIGNNVTYIGGGAFCNNSSLASITIGAGVSIGTHLTSRMADFVTHYDNQGRAAGTYTFVSGAWTGP